MEFDIIYLMDKFTSDVFRFISLIIIAIVLPLFLIPIIKIIGYSEIIEEIAKAMVVFFVVLELPTFRKKIAGAIIFGLIFALSESIFYLTNIFQLGDFSIFWQRLVLTTPLHIITALVILLPALKNKFLIFAGLFFAIIFHLLFNYLI
ncbi:MAG: PrsW family glutamic-type intramembrane protease [Candidatus Paceibacterota bacterium]